MIRTVIAAGLVLGLAACAESTPADRTSADDRAPYNRIDPVEDPLAEASGPPQLAVGTWSEAMVDGQAALLFGTAGAPSLSLICDSRAGLIVQRHGVRARAGIDMMEISTAGSVSRLALNALETETPVLRSSIPYNDDLLAQLANADGRITITAGNAPPLVVAADPMIGDLIRRCARPPGESEES